MQWDYKIIKERDAGETDAKKDEGALKKEKEIKEE